METKFTWIKWIQERISVRTFEEIEIQESVMVSLNSFIQQTQLGMDKNLRFEIIEKTDDTNQTQKLGTYGIIKGTNSFIAGIMNNQTANALELGYHLEKIILYATGLGLGTCWLGGTYNRKDFENYLSLNQNETLAVLIAFGYKKDKQSLIESTMRLVAKSNQRKPWKELFFNQNTDTELLTEETGSYATVLEMVRIAPSASNKQPWRIIKTNHSYDFYLCRTPAYGIATYDLQLNDLGIAKCHFELAANELNLKGQWSTKMDPNIITEWEYICTWEIIN